MIKENVFNKLLKNFNATFCDVTIQSSSDSVDIVYIINVHIVPILWIQEVFKV